MDKGKNKGVADAIILEKLFNNKIFKIIEPEDNEFTRRLMKTRGLHKADAEVLSLARELEGLAIIDDELASNVAKIYEMSYAGTPYI